MLNLLEVITNPIGFVVIMLLMLLVVGLSLIISRQTQQQLNLPHIKGGWPILGNALQMNQYGRSDQTMEMWAKQYGPIFSVQVFNMTWVVLSGYDEIYEALVQKSRAFAGRYKYFRVSCLIFYNKNIGIGDPTQSQWLPMRKAFHRFIQPMGNNLNRVETVLIKTVQQFIAKVKSYAGKEVDLRDDINNFVLKVAIAMLIGQNVEDNSQLLAEIKLFDQLVLESVSPISGMELDFLPWLRFFGNPTWKKLKNVIQLRDKLFDEVWQIGKASYSSDQPPKCAIHAMAQLVDEKSPFYEPTMTREFTIGLFNDVLGTSVITTSTTSYALLNLLIHNPSVYKRLQEEVR